jgi:hypothetical protein
MNNAVDFSPRDAMIADFLDRFRCEFVRQDSKHQAVRSSGEVAAGFEANL